MPSGAAGHAQLGYASGATGNTGLHRLCATASSHLAGLYLGQCSSTVHLSRSFLLLLLVAYLLQRTCCLRAPVLLRPDRVIAGLIRWPRRGELWRSIGVLVACAIALIALFAPYAYYADMYGLARNPGDIQRMLPRIGSYLLADSSWLWGRFSQSQRNPCDRIINFRLVALACWHHGIARGASHWLKYRAQRSFCQAALNCPSLYAFIEQFHGECDRTSQLLVWVSLVLARWRGWLVVGARGRAVPLLAQCWRYFVARIRPLQTSSVTLRLANRLACASPSFRLLSRCKRVLPRHRTPSS